MPPLHILDENLIGTFSSVTEIFNYSSHARLQVSLWYRDHKTGMGLNIMLTQYEVVCE